MRSGIVLLSLLLLITGCEDLSDKPLLTKPRVLIAVDGNITSENKSHLITLSFPYQIQNATPAPVTGATVTITVDNIQYPLNESPAGSGLYYTPVFRAVTGKSYTLAIFYQGKTFTAQDSPPAVEPMDALSYQAVGSEYSLTSAPSGSQANFIRHVIEWKNTSACMAGSTCDGEIYYYDLKSADVNDIFKPDKEDFDFPQGATVIRTKYSVSAAYRDFLRSMLSETEWSGGVFDVQHAPVETNLSDGAIGFFAASTVVSDTTVIH